jgi:hypothetical protein
MLSEYSQRNRDLLLGDSNPNQLIKNKEFQRLYSFLQSHSSTIQKLIMNQTMKSFPNNSFISPSLFKKSQEYSNCITFHWLTINHLGKQFPCTLHFYCTDFKTINQSFVQSLLKSISFILSYSPRLKQYVFHFVPLPDKKTLSKNTKSFTKHMINSGCSSHTKKESIIYLWRLEEYSKVLFHECIHSFITQDNLEDHKLLQKYKKRYHLQSTTIDFEESFIELWAKIINCYYISQLYPVKNPYEYFCSLVSIEKEYCLQQAFKILSFKKDHNIEIDTHTNVTSYYLITAELFQNLIQFISSCQQLKYLYLTDKYFFYQFLRTTKKIKQKKCKVNDNSLRMSSTELKL